MSTVNACVPQPFVGTQQFEIPFGTTISKLTRVPKGLGFFWRLDICRRSAIPIYGVKVDANTRVLVKYSTVLLGICDVTQSIAYTATGVITPGVVLHDDAALAVPHAGANFVVDLVTGTIFNINIVTGVVGASTGSSCPTSVIMPETTFSFLPSTKGQEQTLIDVAASAFAASLAIAQNTVNPPDTYSGTPDYSLYLYNKIGSDQCLYNRYLEVYNKMAQFFRLHAAIGAFDIGIYKELTDQIAKVMRESDKQMMLPPGSYVFDVGSVAQSSLEKWFAADNTLAGLYSIEAIHT